MFCLGLVDIWYLLKGGLEGGVLFECHCVIMFT